MTSSLWYCGNEAFWAGSIVVLLKKVGETLMLYEVVLLSNESRVRLVIM